VGPIDRSCPASAVRLPLSAFRLPPRRGLHEIRGRWLGELNWRSGLGRSGYLLNWMRSVDWMRWFGVATRAGPGQGGGRLRGFLRNCLRSCGESGSIWNPWRWMATWWWNQQRVARFCSSVAPPSCQWMMWWGSSR